jgi:hypothetical protein
MSDKKTVNCVGIIVIEQGDSRVAKYSFYEEGHFKFETSCQLMQVDLDIPVSYVRFGLGQTLSIVVGTTYEEALQQLQAYKPSVADNAEDFS